MSALLSRRLGCYRIILNGKAVDVDLRKRRRSHGEFPLIDVRLSGIRG
ncbi:hypothetical protein IWX88_001474 [Frigoribacterium sp. CG_9.8]|nr:hypothetical protein [Frigoribacterium sp. CG_9.8]